MEIELWASHFHLAKHIAHLHSTGFNSETNTRPDNAQGTEEKAYLECPFCYVDVELSIICSHLQQEHCFDVNNSVCPVCAATLGAGAILHFATEHSHLIKRRKPRTELSNSNTFSNSEEDQNLNLFTDDNTKDGTTSSPSSDPLLSPFLFGITLVDTNEKQESKYKPDVKAETLEKKSMSTAIYDERTQQTYDESMKRVEFVQQLVWSTMFPS